MINPGNNKYSCSDGAKIGRLSLGPIVYMVRDHPLLLITPKSYLRQGRLREVTCECGNQRLIAESVLVTGRVMSCGCLRAEIREQARQKFLDKDNIKLQQRLLTAELKSEQARLKYYLSLSVKDHEKIEECSEKVRNLFKKQLPSVNYNKKISNRRHYQQRKLKKSLGIE